MNDKTKTRILTLPTDSNERKNVPLLTGCLNYFPAALAGVANVSKQGNDKHNPGQPLHHDRSKSMDHGDCILRHLTDVEDLIAAEARGDQQVSVEAILLEANQLAWRALSYAQMLHEKFGAPLAPGAKDEKKSLVKSQDDRYPVEKTYALDLDEEKEKYQAYLKESRRIAPLLGKTGK